MDGRKWTWEYIYTDGEKDPDLELVRELIAEGTLDMHWLIFRDTDLPNGDD